MRRGCHANFMLILYQLHVLLFVICIVIPVMQFGEQFLSDVINPHPQGPFRESRPFQGMVLVT